MRVTALAIWLVACQPTPPGQSDRAPSQPDTPEPAEPEARIEPPDLLPLEQAWCVVDAPDDDGASVEWTVDGLPWQGPTLTSTLPGDTVPPNVVQSGETWRCEASAPTWTATASADVQPTIGGNVLVIVVDDLGVDNVGFWFDDPAVVPPPTPTIDALAAQGVTFRNAYSYAKCSPSRSALLTGRYGRRTGAVSLMGVHNWYEVPTNEVTLAELAQRAGYATSAVGKWHLSTTESPNTYLHPHASGFDWYGGSLGNLDVTTPGNYFGWRKSVNGLVGWSDVYATTDTTNDAIDRLGTMPEPWFAWVSYNAPHFPWHVPPSELTGLTTDPQGTAEKFDAAVMALDTELQRLLDSIDADVRDRTTILFVSDNGTPEGAITDPFDDERGKFTPYEGGVHVPMIVTGPAVTTPGTSSDALVHLVDFLPTVAALTGASLRDLQFDETEQPVPLDGVPFLRQLLEPDAAGQRALVFGEVAEPNGGPPYRSDVRWAQDDTWKLIQFDDHEELFDKRTALYDEGLDLLTRTLSTDELDHYARLSTWLDERVAAMDYDGPEAPEQPPP